MKMRSLFFVVSVCAVTMQTEAAFTLQELNLMLERGIIHVAGFADSIGAYFNLCRPPLKQALSDAASTFGQHLSDLNVGSAIGSVADSAELMTNQQLPYAPTTTLFKEYMRETKAVLLTLASVAGCYGIYRLFFAKKSNKSKK